MALSSVLAQLEDAQLIRFTPELEPAYIFKNVLSQQAAYESLLSKNRRELHRHVAETYEKLYRDRLDQIASLLAQHYGEAGDRAKTFEYSVRAAAAAMRIYANAEAIAHYSRAVELAKGSTAAAPDKEQGHVAAGSSLRELYLNRGRALELSGRYDEVLKNYEEMETLAQACGDRAMELDALIALATVRSTPTTLHNATLARSLSDRALEVAREIGDRASEAKILWNLLNHSIYEFRPREGVQYGEQALAIATGLRMDELRAFILNDINRAYFAIGEIDRARKSVELAQTLWRELNNLPMLADNYASAAQVSLYGGDWDAGLAFSQKAADLARSIGNPWTLSYALSTQAEFFLERGEVDMAMAVLNESLTQAHQAGFPIGWGMGRSELAMTYAYLGAVERGLALVRQVLSDIGDMFDMFRPLVMSYLVRLNLRQGNLPAAQAAADQGLEKIAGEPFNLYASPAVALADAELALAKKDYARAIEAVQPIVEKAFANGAQFRLLDALLVQGQAWTALGNLEEAEEILAQACTRAEEIQSRRTLWQILAAQSEIASLRGNAAEAKKLREQARGIANFIADHVSDRELRSSFLAQPAVRALTE